MLCPLAQEVDMKKILLIILGTLVLVSSDEVPDATV
jgi:hypothetical protein